MGTSIRVGGSQSWHFDFALTGALFHHLRIDIRNRAPAAAVGSRPHDGARQRPSIGGRAMIDMLIGAVAGVGIFIALEWWLVGRKPSRSRGSHGIR
jgi:hypothetical protein